MRVILENDSFALGGATGEVISGLGHWPEVGAQSMKSCEPHVPCLQGPHFSMAVTLGLCSSASQPFLGHRSHRK